MPDGRSIEMHYQCDIKQYAPGGTDWRLGKGKPPLDPSIDLWEAYKSLWRVWVHHNPDLFTELGEKAKQKDGILSDCFASTPISQARALAELLNERM
jgi:hypothetical protein